MTEAAELTEQDLWQRFDAACEIDDSAAQTEAIRDVARRAEAAGHTEVLVHARLGLVNALIHWALQADVETEVAICHELPVAFTRCLALHDRVPEHFGAEELDLLWIGLSVTVRAMVLMSEWPAERIRAVLDDMEPRCRPDRDDHLSLSALRVDLEARVGDIAAADAALERMRSHSRPDYWVAGGDVVFQVEYLADVERDEEAITTLLPLLTGVAPCRDEDNNPTDPNGHLVYLLLPYLRTGRLAEASAAYERVGREVAGSDDDNARALLMEFHARTGNEERELAHLREHGLVDGPARTYHEMRYTAALGLVLRRLAAHGHGAESFELHPEDDDSGGAPRRVTVAEYLPEAVEDALRFAHKADAHNGTSYQSERVHALIHAEPVVEHLPLPPIDG